MDIREKLRICRGINAAVLIVLGCFIFLFPGATTLMNLMDPGIRTPAIPDSAWRLHRTLTPRFEHWAMERINSSRATQLSIHYISGTEWPLFGSVFYLWATETLQEAWDKNPKLSAQAPKDYAKSAIGAATRLVIDPKQASWVSKHWGEKYLKTENVFYRMLVIAALTSHAQLSGENQYLPMLKDQVESLSTELDASPYGLLDDYPGQCYPGDVLTAIAMIHKADKVLGTDHSDFVARAIRGFQGRALDQRSLVPYAAYARQGLPMTTSRGCGNSYVSLFAPEIWPEQAKRWYEHYERHFWQEKTAAAGFREFPKDLPGYEWYFDVDSGPVLSGYGFAADAYGVGAARVNGHFEHAYPMTSEMYATSWPLIDGTLLVPRFLSNATDAPYIGETSILYVLTRMPAAGVTVRSGGSVPGLVYIILLIQMGMATLLLTLPMLEYRRWRKHRDQLQIPWPEVQFKLWVSLLIVAAVAVAFGNWILVAIVLITAQLVPKYRRVKMISYQ